VNVHAQSTESKQARRARRLRDPDILQDPQGTGEKRQYIKITPEMEGEVLAVRHRLGIGATFGDIAEEVNLPSRTVRYILTQMPHLKRQQSGDEVTAASLKDRIYDVISTVLVIRDVPELRALLGMGDPEHDVVHVLHSLHSQGRIDFDERGNGQGTATYVNIRMPKRGPKPKPVEANNDDGIPSGFPRVPAGEPAPEPVAQVTAPVEAQPTPVEEGYPLLVALVAREAQRREADEKGLTYLAAAETLKDVDPEMYRELIARAEGDATPFPSPLEREYLRYAQTVPLPQPIPKESK